MWSKNLNPIPYNYPRKFEHKRHTTMPNRYKGKTTVIDNIPKAKTEHGSWP